MALSEEVWEGFDVLNAQADVLVGYSSTFGYVTAISFCLTILDKCSCYI